MKENIGLVDKLVRFLIGSVIIVLGMYYQNWLGLLGLLPIFTAVIGYCGLYAIFGVGTAKHHKS
jgi:hypothetical protein